MPVLLKSRAWSLKPCISQPNGCSWSRLTAIWITTGKTRAVPTCVPKTHREMTALRSPKNSASAGATYTMPMANNAQLALRADAVYQSRIWYSADDPVPTDPSIGFQNAYTLVNARATWISPEENWEVSLFGTNLTDKEYFHGMLSLVGLLQRQQG